MGKSMDFEIHMQDHAIKKQKLLKDMATTIIKEYGYAVKSEMNNDSGERFIISKLESVMKDFSDYDKFIVMSYVFMKLC